MARESTIKYTFNLQKALRAAATLETPGITKGATTTIQIASADPGFAAGYYAIGQLLLIQNSGVAALDNRLHMISASNSGTGLVTIQTDTSASPETPAAFGDVDVYAVEWQEVCLTEFSPSPGTPGEIDATTMCDEERVNLPGLASPGTATLGGVFDLDDLGMAELIAAKEAADTRYMVGSTRNGQMAVFHGVVSSFSIGNLTVESVVPFTGTFTLDESPYYMKKAV